MFQVFGILPFLEFYGLEILVVSRGRGFLDECTSEGNKGPFFPKFVFFLNRVVVIFLS